MAALSVSMNHVTATIIFFVFVAQVNVMVNVCFANGDQSNILCHETEKQALLSFKRDLVDYYNKLVSWDVSEDEDCCKWAGISCNTLTGHVSELSIKGGIFTGKTNPSLLNLTHLINLDLSCSHFGGIKIPSFMGSFVSLRYLNLTQGGFTGMIPHQLGNLSSLLYLDLGYNNDLYVDNLHWVSGLSSLKSLVMYEVNLSKAINTLPSLQELRLYGCDLGHIHFPSHINLTSLETLDLSFNSLELESPVPCTFLNNISLLKYLDLSENNMNSVIPKCFYSFPNLAHLYLIGNNLQGTISSDIANLTSIVSFDLSHNALAGNIPKSIGKLCNLEELYIFGNQLSGSLPESLGSLSKLQTLYVSNNQLSGPLSESFGSLSNLEILNIEINNLEGVVSEVHFANLTKLTHMYASRNKLILNVSSCWTPPFSLYAMELNNWNLGHHFPIWLKSQKSTEDASTEDGERQDDEYWF